VAPGGATGQAGCVLLTDSAASGIAIFTVRVEEEAASTSAAKWPVSAASEMIDPTNTPPERESDILRRTLEILRSRLPDRWETAVDEEVRIDTAAQADALVRLEAPDGSRAILVLEAKRLVEARDLPRILDQLARTVEGVRSEPGRADRAAVEPMVVARYLSPRTRQRLEDAATSYADATGNLSLSVDQPALFLRDVGAQRDPWRRPGRPRESYRGTPAARVVRALADFAPPMTVPELAKRSGASAGATYRMVDLLESDAYIEREERKAITRVDWRQILERWSQDYEFAGSNPTAAFLQPRGLKALEATLREASSRYAISGSIAAECYARYAPARLGMVYVDDLDRAAEELGLRTVEGGANVLLAAPKDDFVYERSEAIEGLTYAAPSQVAVDLLTSPGRGPSEAVVLLDWMEQNEPAWRR